MNIDQDHETFVQDKEMILALNETVSGCVICGTSMIWKVNQKQPRTLRSLDRWNTDNANEAETEAKRQMQHSIASGPTDCHQTSVWSWVTEVDFSVLSKNPWINGFAQFISFHLKVLHFIHKGSSMDALFVGDETSAILQEHNWWHLAAQSCWLTILLRVAWIFQGQVRTRPLSPSTLSWSWFTLAAHVACFCLWCFEAPAVVLHLSLFCSVLSFSLSLSLSCSVFVSSCCPQFSNAGALSIFSQPLLDLSVSWNMHVCKTHMHRSKDKKEAQQKWALIYRLLRQAPGIFAPLPLVLGSFQFCLCLKPLLPMLPQNVCSWGLALFQTKIKQVLGTRCQKKMISIEVKQQQNLKMRRNSKNQTRRTTGKCCRDRRWEHVRERNFFHLIPSESLEEQPWLLPMDLDWLHHLLECVPILLTLSQFWQPNRKMFNDISEICVFVLGQARQGDKNGTPTVCTVQQNHELIQDHAWTWKPQLWADCGVIAAQNQSLSLPPRPPRPAWPLSSQLNPSGSLSSDSSATFIFPMFAAISDLDVIVFQHCCIKNDQFALSKIPLIVRKYLRITCKCPWKVRIFLWFKGDERRFSGKHHPWWVANSIQFVLTLLCCFFLETKKSEQVIYTQKLEKKRWCNFTCFPTGQSVRFKYLHFEMNELTNKKYLK